MNAQMEWKAIRPQVNQNAEFKEITNDFGDPLEILREAISNAIDASASHIKIWFAVERIDGTPRLVLRLEDDGHGMVEDVLARDFWGLGYSTSREDKEKIGEKGHGTKIYLRSLEVQVRTQSKERAFESVCERPLARLSAGQLHEPRLRQIDRYRDGDGTDITIIGYNDSQRSRFIQEFVKDYILWFTKVGSIERIFGIEKLRNFRVLLRCIDKDQYEEIGFGHVFPAEDSDINKLFEAHGTEAADLYVKRYVYKDQRLKNFPEVVFDCVISIEGDEVKRNYNPMIRERVRGDGSKYRVGDRYGVWLCKDYIPVTRVNEWISGFGSGSNAFLLIHGFVNCQNLQLTANRGTIANSDPAVLEELKAAVAALIKNIDTELDKSGLYVLRTWQQEEQTQEQERNDFQKRTKLLKQKKIAELDKRILTEPKNESELFGTFMIVQSLRPDLFDFEPLDYNTTRGIDLIARITTRSAIIEGEFHYLELKYLLQSKKKFNHSFEHLRWILCWDFDRGVAEGAEFMGIDEADTRILKVEREEGKSYYFLDNRRKARKIEIIRLKEYLEQSAGIHFRDQPAK